MRDFKELWVNVEIKVVYKKPPSSAKESIEREQEQIQWQIKADRFSKEIEKRLNEEFYINDAPRLPIYTNGEEG